ncbi:MULTISPECIES: amino acid permease [unclassified Streptomyces]|uniref:amino acid permease n=1 Tax=unclassified Streptomyces TaxID=2593676 RepID=UPI0020344939|nr:MULTISPECIES: amino acid permease [unclassified Streptomyces]MCM2419588.1 amino acid permease [Streptomyces sp. RKAG293]MCM2428214.1 amino acid permease [Streptomyces sp. RKAG337]
MPTEHTRHEAAAADAAAAPVTEEGYQRGLGSRQIQMIAIGGAIGTGLFLGAGKAIHQAGPSLIMMYAIAGVIIFFIMRALGELLTYRPVSGSFADYAREFLGPFWGFVTGWTYWLMWVVTGMAEVTAASVYITYWWKDIPQWISALIFLLVLFGVNLISVKVFGEVEFWFSMIKVTAIIGMILIGIGVLTIGFSAAGDTASLSHLWGDGGVFPNGVGKSLMTLQIVMFAYLAVELVGVTAGEAENPRETLPKAINTLPWRIGVFYVGALIVILGVVSWTEFQPGVSPFVAAFAKIGIPFGAAIVNFVVLTAALSSCNSGMYSTGRMLRDLAVNGQGPRAFAKLNSRQTPAAGILVSVALMGIGVWINYVDPDGAFTYITAFATVAGVWTWAMILISHLRYRAAVKAGRAAEAWFKAPGAPYTSWIALIFLAGVMVLIGIDKDARISLYSAPVWFAILGIGYAWLKRKNPEAFAPKPHVAPEPALADAAS